MAYPLLLRGDECGEDSENFHWRIILEYNLSDYPYIETLPEKSRINLEVIDSVKKFPIYLSRDYGDSSEVGEFHITTCVEVCKRFWRALPKTLDK